MTNMQNPYADLSGKTILVTGASTGIGQQVAIILDTLGANLVLHASKIENLSDTKALLNGGSHLYFEADFSVPTSLEAVVGKEIPDNIRLDGFVNCVGIRSRRPINTLKPDHLINVLQTNFVSFVEMVRLITRKNAYNPGLSIVSISSVSSQVGGSGITAYAASKAAVDAASRCLSKELAKKQVRINTVVSGQINTSAYQEMMIANPMATDGVLDRQFLGLGEPSDVANVVVFLLSNLSRFISGATLPADGGFLT